MAATIMEEWEDIADRNDPPATGGTAEPVTGGTVSTARDWLDEEQTTPQESRLAAFFLRYYWLQGGSLEKLRNNTDGAIALRHRSSFTSFCNVIRAHRMRIQSKWMAMVVGRLDQRRKLLSDSWWLSYTFVHPVPVTDSDSQPQAAASIE